MEGLQLQKALDNINEELKMLHYLTETPVQLGRGSSEGMKQSINDIIKSASKLKENIDNLKFIE